MLYLVYGENTVKSLNKLNELLANLREKRGNEFSFFEMADDFFDESYFKQLLYSNHLFGNKNLIVLKRIFENKNLLEYFKECLPRVCASQNIFIFWEKNLDDEILDIFQKNAQKVWQFQDFEKQKKNATVSPTSGAKLENRLIFNFIDAFSQRKKRSAWLALQKAIISGINEEEIFWKLVWQIKNMNILKSFENLPPQTISKEIKLHPFVLQKTLKILPLFSKNELARITENLINIYARNRYDKIELNFGIEKIIFNL